MRRTRHKPRPIMQYIYGTIPIETDFGDALQGFPIAKTANTAYNKMRHSTRDTGTVHITISRVIIPAKNTLLNWRQYPLRNFHTDYIDLFHPSRSLMNPRFYKQQGKILIFVFCPLVVFCKNICRLNTTSWEISILHLAPFINGELDYCLQTI